MAKAQTWMTGHREVSPPKERFAVCSLRLLYLLHKSLSPSPHHVEANQLFPNSLRGSANQVMGLRIQEMLDPEGLFH